MRTVLRVPTLAAHLDRQETFSFNQETQLFPIAGLVAAELNRRDKPTEAYDKETAEDKPSEFTPLKPMSTRHHPRFVKLIAAELDEEVEDIVDFEIVLYDTQKACLGGLMEEFIFSARLDNLNSTYCATMGLIESVRSETALDKETSVRMIACFDHEEVGSMSAQGAFSTMLPGVARRLSVLPMAAFTQAASENSYDNVSKAESEHSCDRVSEEGMATAYEQTMSSSFLLSADMAHAVNPNFGAKYESDHRPEMNKGPVIKVNANAHYATNSPGIVLLQEVARKEGVPLQLFVVRNDSSCGSTIGPILAAHLGARTLDLGNPQISMHSCRECGGADDVHHAIRLFHGFFQYYSALEKTILVD